MMLRLPESFHPNCGTLARGVFENGSAAEAPEILTLGPSPSAP